MWKAHGKLRVKLLFDGKFIKEAVFDSNKISIGRDPACDFVIDNQLVSGRHARITRTGAGYVIEDLGSTNGVLIGGRPIQREVLRIGTVVTIGKHRLELVEQGESTNPDHWGKATIAPRTEGTIAVSQSEAEDLHAQVSYEAFLQAGGRPAELRLVKGRGTPATLNLRKKVSVVGKDPASDLCLSGMWLPVTAFFVERSKKAYQVSPAAKKVLLNGTPIESRETLADGDQIRVGSATLRFKLVG